MIPIDSIAGAWKIDESPEGHAYGPPNTHWLLVENRVMVIRDRISSPNIFDMKMWVKPCETGISIGFSGLYGGHGFAEVDGDFLFISIGKNGRSLPRFAPDCGWFFAFTRDYEVQLPVVNLPLRNTVMHPVLGQLQWNAQLQEWVGAVAITDESVSEVILDDTLVPLDIQVQQALTFIDWLRANLSNAILACAERLREWVVPEDQHFDEWPLAQFTKSISIDSIVIGVHDINLWASTSIPIDHSLRVSIKMDNNHFELDGITVEG